MKKYILLICTILLMVLIFCFSAQPADESTELSNSVGYFIGKTLVKDFDQLPYEDQLSYVESIDHTVRKCAHGTEYLILGFLCSWTLIAWFGRKNHLFLLGWLIAALYSVSDEIHQIFVPGRACMFTDICIDCGGALAGSLLLFLICKLSDRKTR